MFPRLLVLVKRVGVEGKMRTALASPAGEPPTQLLALDQRVLAAPVHWCAAGARRFSSASSRGWTGARRAGAGRPRWRRAFRRVSLFHQVPIITYLLFAFAATRSAVQW